MQSPGRHSEGIIAIQGERCNGSAREFTAKSESIVPGPISAVSPGFFDSFCGWFGRSEEIDDSVFGL